MSYHSGKGRNRERERASATEATSKILPRTPRHDRGRRGEERTLAGESVDRLLLQALLALAETLVLLGAKEGRRMSRDEKVRERAGKRGTARPPVRVERAKSAAAASREFPPLPPARLWRRRRPPRPRRPAIRPGGLAASSALRTSTTGRARRGMQRRAGRPRVDSSLLVCLRRRQGGDDGERVREGGGRRRRSMYLADGWRGERRLSACAGASTDEGQGRDRPMIAAGGEERVRRARLRLSPRSPKIRPTRPQRAPPPGSGLAWTAARRAPAGSVCSWFCHIAARRLAGAGSPSARQAGLCQRHGRAALGFHRPGRARCRRSWLGWIGLA